MNPSEEQLLVLDELSKDKSIIIRAVPGAGKTTQILFLVEQFYDKSTLVLTYNSRLRASTKLRISDLNVDFIYEPHVHTYHSFAQYAFQEECHTDRGIHKIINEDLPLKRQVDYDILILDECQDMTPLYFKIIRKIWNSNMILVILGDEYQAIYGYNKADPRFLTLADKLFRGSNRQFEHMKLSVSYRLPRPITDFINNCIIFENRIQPSPFKTGSLYQKPTYIVADAFSKKFHQDIFTRISSFLRSGYHPDDIFILCPTTKMKGKEDKGQRGPVQLLANYLCLTRICECQKNKGNPCSCPTCCICDKDRCSHNINVFVPTSDDSAINDQDVANKIVFCTFHKSKGLERKIVIVLGFDASYHKYFNKDDSDTQCCNPLYVALTRASEKLIIVQSGAPLPYIDQKLINEYATVEVQHDHTPKKIQNRKDTGKILFPSTITMHVPSDVLIKVRDMIVEDIRRESENMIKLNSRHKQPDTVEIVCDITGNFVTGLFALEHGIVNDDGENEIFGPEQKPEQYDKDLVEHLLKKTTSWTSNQSGFIFKKVQIKNFNWVTPMQATKMKNRIIKTIPKKCLVEIPISAANLKLSGHNISIFGRMDIVDQNNKIIWEIKCVEKFTDAHFVQLATYKYINMVNQDYIGWRYFLYNVKNNQISQIIIDDKKLVKMIEYLIEQKYTSQLTTSDEHFLAQNI